MLLYDLKEKQTARITKINAQQAFALRLRDMGFCEGEEVACLKKALLASPVLYRVKGSQIALRKVDAKRIEVKA